MINGLGQLVRVDEPDSNNSLGLTGSPAQPTSYTYDALGNLVTVNQGAQARSFIYSSLSRLTSATNPENGTVTYTYDNNGNPLTKTDARVPAVTISYGYDALNRNTTVDYSDTSSINPDISRFYDGATNGKGLFWYSYAGGNYSVGANVEHTAIDSYDPLGRPLVQRQLSKLNNVWGPTYQISRSYNLAGGVTSQTYPSLRTVTYSYDSAGRTSAFSGNLGDGVSRTYSTGIIYSALGGMSKEQFGTDTALFNKLWYNSRGQLSEIRESTSYTGPTDTSWNRGAIVNHYSNQCWGMCAGYGMTDNNGNVKKQEHQVPDNEQVSSYQSFLQWYSYDNLNRLTNVHEGRFIGGNPNPSSDIYQVYNPYDRYGNRTIDAVQTSPGINAKQFTVDTTNNRLGVPTGQSGTMSYDAVGNLITDTYTGAGYRTYDAENRMITAWGGLNQQQVYTYNADGQRVRRKVDGIETWQVYGFGGELLAEYPANGAASSPQKEYGYRNGQLLITAESSANIKWLVADQLGTPRMIFDKTGSLANTKRHDYLTFGEELFAGINGRTTQQGYTGDNIRQKFTQKERDNETGLDDFGARYYGSIMGRFTSADSFFGSTGNPQTLNRYAYVGNAPPNFTDPTGHARFDLPLSKFEEGGSVNPYEDAIAEQQTEAVISQADAAAKEAATRAAATALAPQNTESGPKVIFDAVELLDDSGAGLPQGPLRVPRPINSIRSATRDEFNQNAFTLDVDDPRVAVDGLIAIRVKFHVVDGDYDSVNVITTSKENRRWDIAERRPLDHNSFIAGVNVYDKEAPVNPIYVNVHASWKASIWDRGKLNDVRYKSVQATIRLIIGPKDR